MTPPRSDHHVPTRQETRSMAITIGFKITLAWITILGASLIVGAALLSRETLETTIPSNYCLISLGNLLVAYLTLMPLRHVGQKKALGENRVAPKRVGAADVSSLMLSGMAIRFIGTIALFVVCRYQMSASDDLIALTCIAWYLIFSAIITHAMATEVKHFDSASED